MPNSGTHKVKQSHWQKFKGLTAKKLIVSTSDKPRRFPAIIACLFFVSTLTTNCFPSFSLRRFSSSDPEDNPPDSHSGDARYTKSIYTLLCRSIVRGLLCYCARARLSESPLNFFPGWLCLFKGRPRDFVARSLGRFATSFKLASLAFARAHWSRSTCKQV